MKLLVIILNYRVTEVTIDCLHSLDGRVQNVKGTRVAVCDNGTGPDAVERLRSSIEAKGWSPWVELSALKTNLGFTGGNNFVIRAATSSKDPPEYVLLLNSDTLVQDGALEALVAFMDSHPRAGIAGSQLLSPAGEVQASPYRFFGIATEFDRGLRLGLVSKVLSRWVAVPPTPEREARVEWVSGASMILRQTMLEEIGLLDEGLFTYFDDIDFCLRARRGGWETWYVPDSRVVHLEGASSGVAPDRRQRLPAYLFEARRRFFLKNYGPLFAACADAAFLTGFACWRIRRRLQRRPDPDPEHMLWDAARHSVFAAGFKVSEVRPDQPPSASEARPG